jgi:hypothetical protein
MSNEKKVHRPSKGRATVIDDPTLQRDLSTGAVINKNHTDYSKRLALKKAMREKDSQITRLEEEVAELREMVNQILKRGISTTPPPPATKKKTSTPTHEDPSSHS